MLCVIIEFGKYNKVVLVEKEKKKCTNVSNNTKVNDNNLTL